MNYLVVYDSVFGNTEKIARAIGEELAKSGQGETLRVTDVETGHLKDLDILLVGSPTRAFQPTPAVKDFFKGLPKSSLKGLRSAAFDTRADIKEVNNALLTFMVGIFGYAAGRIARKLAQKGAQVLTPEGAFFVNGSEGPLKEGELEKAAQWAHQIASA